tara:strand:+ start:7340 stop:8308 length:969 start_codon:yes stop_codon:yes gene_type:complete
MGLAGQNQVRHMYVAADINGASNIATFRTGAAIGDLICLSADGTATAAGEPFKFFLKTAGGIVSSDTIKPGNILSAKALDYAAQTLKVGTISALPVPVTGQLVTAEIIISGFGSYSVEDEYVKKGFYKVVSGDDAEAVVDGLITSLNRNFSREPGADATSNPIFTFAKTGSTTTAALVVTEKAQDDFDKNKRTRKQTQFTVNLSGLTSVPTIAYTGGFAGVGTSEQTQEMEFYLMGERGDFYRGAGYPHNFDQEYQAVAGTNYNLIEIAYFDEGRDEAKKSKKGITLAIPFVNLAGNANVNLIVTNVNTATGVATLTALAVI